MDRADADDLRDGGGVLVVTDDFAGTGALSVNWANFDGLIGSRANGVYSPQVSVAEYNADGWVGHEFSSNHSSKFTRRDPDAGGFIAPGVRISTNNWYGWFNHGSVQKNVNGTVTEVGATEGFLGDAVVKMSISGAGAGQTLALNNETLTWSNSMTDASLSGGRAGIVNYSGAVNTYADDFEATGEIRAYRTIRVMRPRPFAPGIAR